MTLPIVLRQEARAEFDEAFDWYEQQQVGLGVEFAERVQAVFDRISPMPELHAIVHCYLRAHRSAGTGWLAIEAR
jgi:plasmid stabilization system protein ParE